MTDSTPPAPSGSSPSGSPAPAAGVSALSASWVTELGVAACVACLAALIGAVPGALRAASPEVGMPLAWLILAGGSALVLLPFSWALAQGLRGQDVSARIQLVTLGVSVLLAAPLLNVVLRVLKSATHHRPLGAATFALIAALVLIGCLALVGRLAAYAGPQASARAQRPARLALIALALVGGLGTLLAALPLLSAGVIDGLLLVGVATALTARGLPAPRGMLPKLGLGVVLLLVVTSGALSRSDAVLQQLQAQAPVSLGWLWAW